MNIRSEVGQLINRNVVGILSGRNRIKRLKLVEGGAPIGNNSVSLKS